MNAQLVMCHTRNRDFMLASAICLGIWGIVAALSGAGACSASAPQAGATSPSVSQPKAPTAAPAAPVAEQAAARAVVPFEMLPTNHMLVQARINGKGPYSLIFDLGAPITLLSNRASEATGVVKADMPRSFLFGMRGEAEVDKLEVGGLSADRLPVVVFDHPVLNALGKMTGHPIDGIMGFTFFARYKTTINYLAREMTFEPVSYQVRDLLKDLPQRLMGPKVTRRRILAPAAICGMHLGEPIRKLDSPYVPIAAVYDNSPAARAGLRPGDALVALDGRWTTSIADVFRAAANLKPGRDTPVVILRDGREQTLTIRPADGI